MQQSLFGDFRLSDVREGAGNAHDLPVRAGHRACFQAEPKIIGALRAKPEILTDPAAPLLKQSVEAGAESIALRRVEDIKPSGGRPFERAWRKPQLGFELRAGIDPLGEDVELEYGVAAPGEGKRLAFNFGYAARERAARKGILHDGETDEHHNEHQPANEGGRHEIIGERAGDGESRANHPSEKQEPRGNE